MTAVSFKKKNLRFRYNHGAWMWVPIIGPHIGAILGTVVYMLCVGLHWPVTYQASQIARKKSEFGRKSIEEAVYYSHNASTPLANRSGDDVIKSSHQRASEVARGHPSGFRSVNVIEVNNEERPPPIARLESTWGSDVQSTNLDRELGKM